MQAENFWRVTRGSCSVSPGRGASYGLFSGWAFLATILLRLQRCEERGKSITSKAHSPGFCSVTFHLPFCLNSPVCWHPAHMVRSFTGVGDAWESVMRWVPVTCYLGDFRVCVCVCGLRGTVNTYLHFFYSRMDSEARRAAIHGIRHDWETELNWLFFFKKKKERDDLVAGNIIKDFSESSKKEHCGPGCARCLAPPHLTGVTWGLSIQCFYT